MIPPMLPTAARFLPAPPKGETLRIVRNAALTAAAGGVTIFLGRWLYKLIKGNPLKNVEKDQSLQLAGELYNAYYAAGSWLGFSPNADEEAILAIAVKMTRAGIPFKDVQKAFQKAYKEDLYKLIQNALSVAELAEFNKILSEGKK